MPLLNKLAQLWQSNEQEGWILKLQECCTFQIAFIGLVFHRGHELIILLFLLLFLWFFLLASHYKFWLLPDSYQVLSLLLPQLASLPTLVISASVKNTPLRAIFTLYSNGCGDTSFSGVPTHNWNKEVEAKPEGECLVIELDGKLIC